MPVLEKRDESDVESDSDLRRPIALKDHGQPAIQAILTGIKAEEYLPLFIHHGITIDNISELSNEDLLAIGIIDLQDRKNILKEIEYLPLSYRQHVSDPLCMDDADAIKCGVTKQITKHLDQLNLAMRNGLLRSCGPGGDAVNPNNPLLFPGSEYSSIAGIEIVNALLDKLKGLQKNVSLNRKNIMNKGGPNLSKFLMAGAGIGAMVVLSVAIIKYTRQ